MSHISPIRRFACMSIHITNRIRYYSYILRIRTAYLQACLLCFEGELLHTLYNCDWYFDSWPTYIAFSIWGRFGPEVTNISTMLMMLFILIFWGRAFFQRKVHRFPKIDFFSPISSHNFAQHFSSEWLKVK